jgi:rare lipoprotein A (peptidoglycan hydrolase)
MTPTEIIVAGFAAFTFATAPVPKDTGHMSNREIASVHAMFVAPVVAPVVAHAPIAVEREEYHEGSAALHMKPGTTACGSQWNPNELVASHATLPCGSEIVVTNPATGKNVTVRVVDRTSKRSRHAIILSPAAGDGIGLTKQQGVLKKVRVGNVSTTAQKKPRKHKQQSELLRNSPMPDDKIIGANIRKHRDKCNMTQERLGLLCDQITYQQVQKYESGRSRVSGSRLCQISRALKVPPVMFFEGTSAYRAMAGFVNVADSPPVQPVQTPARETQSA